MFAAHDEHHEDDHEDDDRGSNRERLDPAGRLRTLTLWYEGIHVELLGRNWGWVSLSRHYVAVASSCRVSEHSV
jgi:hypothetical protein